MTVMQSYSLSLTYTSLRMDVSQTAPATVPTSPENAPVAKTGDTVTLSPEATAPHVVGETAPQVVNETPTSAQPEVSVSEPPSPEVPPAPTSLAGRRAEALLGALDADQDGAVTKEEFLDGAMALLRSATPTERNGEMHYYELTLTGTHTADLKRFSAGKSQAGKRAVPFVLTHEAVAKVVADLVG